MTNAAAIGYMILAARKLGLKTDVIQRLESIMYSEMDFMTEDEAERVYRQS